MKRALVSVTNKEGIVEFCLGLERLGYEIVSTGGTLRKLKEDKKGRIKEYINYVDNEVVVLKSIPSGTYIVFDESLIATTVPPNSITFFKQYKATLPEPDIITFLLFKSKFLYVFKASRAK